MAVLLRSHEAQVGAAVIQWIAVDVIHQVAGTRLHNDAVHVVQPEMAIMRHKPDRVARAGQEPLDLLKLGEEIGIDPDEHAR